MLNRRRRFFAVFALLMLAAPLVVGLVAPDSPAAVLKEGRRLSAAPQIPAAWADWLFFPAEIDAYLKDHFGLRQAMIRAHKDLTKPLLAMGTDRVLVGRDGRMFYLGEEAVRQSAGIVVRDQRVADAVDLIAAMRDDLARRGVRFLVAAPPNAATVYQDDLPDWAQNRGKRTEYDLFIEGLAARGVTAVDLRPVLEKARAGGAGLFPARHPLDGARRAHGLQRRRRSGRPSRLAARSGRGPCAAGRSQGRRSGAAPRGAGQRDRRGRGVGFARRRKATADVGSIRRLCAKLGQAGSDHPHHRQFVHRGASSSPCCCSMPAGSFG